MSPAPRSTCRNVHGSLLAILRACLRTSSAGMMPVSPEVVGSGEIDVTVLRTRIGRPVQASQSVRHTVGEHYWMTTSKEAVRCAHRAERVAAQSDALLSLSSPKPVARGASSKIALSRRTVSQYVGIGSPFFPARWTGDFALRRVRRREGGRKAIACSSVALHAWTSPGLPPIGSSHLNSKYRYVRPSRCTWNVVRRGIGNPDAYRGLKEGTP